MMQPGWQVQITPGEIVSPVGLEPEWAVGWEAWLRTAGVAPGTPFILSPSFEYDVRLNGFFQSGRLRSLAPRTQLGYARDLAAFLTFLWSARGATRWVDATESDHVAYLFWRRHDPAGPCVAGTTWNREVAAVNQFYRWALWAGHLQVHPIPQMTRRSGVRRAGWANAASLDEQRPATFARDVGSGPVRWLPAASYRRWRDVGVRGFTADGELDPRFRGRWAARNAVFCDLMVRTGLRLGEQGALVLSELPLQSRGSGGYQRFWLPEAIAKGGSARTLADIADRERQTHLRYLAEVLAAEVDDRTGRRLARRINDAQLPRLKRLADHAEGPANRRRLPSGSRMMKVRAPHGSWRSTW